MSSAVARFLKDLVNPSDVLIVETVYREPKGAPFALSAFGIPISWGRKCQRIQLGNSGYFRFAVQLVGGVLKDQVESGAFKHHHEWRPLHIKERNNRREECVLVSVTSIAKRLGVSKEMVIAASDSEKLERFLAGQSIVA